MSKVESDIFLHRPKINKKNRINYLQFLNSYLEQIRINTNKHLIIPSSKEEFKKFINSPAGQKFLEFYK